MSTRAERRRQEKQQTSSPRKLTSGSIAVIVAVVAMVAIVAYAVVERNKAAQPIPPPLAVGTVAPSFSVETNNGVISNSTFAAKPYLLEIFATWCPHCQNMTAVLRDVLKKFPPSKLGMVAVTGSPIGRPPEQNPPEDQADVNNFDAEYGVKWPTAFDKDLTVAKAWGFAGFPGIFIVDKKGIILFEHSGEVPEKTLLDEIKKAGA